MIRDPAIFQYGMLLLYVAALIRHAYAGNWWNCLYWVSAGLINVAVTFGMKGR